MARLSAPDSGPVRLAVVGLGSFGTLHALTVLGLAEARLAAVVARRQASLDAFAARAPGIPGYLDLGAALAAGGIDGWIVASSTPTHVPLTRQLLAAGQKVLVEKPLASSLDEALALQEVAEPASQSLMVGHILLFSSEFRQLLELVPRSGPIRYIDAVRHRPVRTLELYPGESPFHLTMTHDLYCVQVLRGSSEPIGFSAHVHRNGRGQDDLAAARLQWADGTIASVTASFLAPPGMPTDGFDRMEVFGDGWAARLQPNPRPFELYRECASWPMALEIRTDAEGPTGMLAEQLRCFCRVIRGTQAVPAGATYMDALQLLSWLDRLQASVVA